MSNPYSSLEPRICPRCEGKGTTFSKGFTTQEGRVYPDKTSKCYNCDGALQFYPPNLDEILVNIKGRKGLRSARPKEARSYYVWRLARFHGGADVTMPMMADLELGSDPFKKELDQISEQVAKVVFGTDMAAACRWGGLLTNVDTVKYARETNQPASAFPCGPVADGDKPQGEWPELH